MSRDHAHEHRLRFAGNFHVLLVILLITIFLESFAAESALIRELMRAGVLLTLLAALQVIARSSPTARSTWRPSGPASSKPAPRRCCCSRT